VQISSQDSPGCQAAFAALGNSAERELRIVEKCRRLSQRSQVPHPVQTRLTALPQGFDKSPGQEIFLMAQAPKGAGPNTSRTTQGLPSAPSRTWRHKTLGSRTLHSASGSSAAAVAELTETESEDRTVRGAVS
jgi:hypothetical protein